MTDDRIVMCMKWGTLYPADYVNVLYNACRSNLTGPFRFICFTDDSRGFAAGIETFPIPDIGCTSEMWQSGAWPKLSVFLPDLYGLAGRALFIDLDTVICGPLDRFFKHPHPFVAIDTGSNWHPGKQPGGDGALVGTGVFAFDIGNERQILSGFQADRDTVFKTSRLEQVWVQKTASSLAYWPEGWVISFKRWLRQPVGLDLIFPPRRPPASAGLIAFHGNPRPIALLQCNRRWDRLPHLGRGQVAWMREYWTANGGTIGTAEEHLT